jgi:hypothetical protein
MAAGQLGGLLFPIHELKDQRREETARWDFGHGIEAWNKHEYPKAVALFREHVKNFPVSPWAAEAELHIGCDGTYNGRYTEAEAIFRKLIAQQWEISRRYAMFATSIAYLIDEQGVITHDVAVGTDAILGLLAKRDGQGDKINRMEVKDVGLHNEVPV